MCAEVCEKGWEVILKKNWSNVMIVYEGLKMNF